MKRSLLIIEDDSALSDGLSEIFADEGYAIVVSNDPLDALEKLKASAFDVIFLDIKLPRMNGLELLRHYTLLKPDGQHPSRIYIISGDPNAQALLKEQRLEHWVSGVISKPFNISAMLKAVVGY